MIALFWYCAFVSASKNDDQELCKKCASVNPGRDEFTIESFPVPCCVGQGPCTKRASISLIMTANTILIYESVSFILSYHIIYCNTHIERISNNLASTLKGIVQEENPNHSFKKQLQIHLAQTVFRQLMNHDCNVSLLRPLFLGCA